MKKSIGRLVSILHRQSQIYYNEILKNYNITSAEYSFLLSLYAKDGQTQEDLSAYLYIDKSATARAIKSLEEKGFLTRVKDAKDKRFNRVFLTDIAMNCKDEVREKVLSWSEFLMEDMDEENSELLYTLLESLVTKVDKNKL